MDGKYGVAHEAGVVVQSADGMVDAEIVRSPVSGLNRRIIPVDKSLLESLEEPKTRSKSLCDRICGLWLLRKIIDLFRKLFVSSRKNIDLDSGEAARPEDGVAVKAEARKEISEHELRLSGYAAKSILLLYDVQDLGRMLEKQDPSSDNWTIASVSLEKIKTRLDQLEVDIAAFESCQSQLDKVKDRKKLAELTERREIINMYADWVEFYIRDSRADGYYNCNMRYYDATLTHLYNAAKKALSGKKSLLGDLDALYQTARSSAEKKIKDGHAYTAIEDVNQFKTGILSLVDSVNRRNKYQREFARSLPARGFR